MKFMPRIDGDPEVLAGVFFVDVPAFGAERPIGDLAAAVAHASQAEARYGDSGFAKSCEFHSRLTVH